MDKKDYRLRKSKTFCMAPFLSLNNNPNGDIIPCCVAQCEKPFGNTFNNNIDEIWNNEEFSRFRKDLLEDKKSPICIRCHKEEEWGSTSSRTYWNQNFANKYDELVENATNENGQMSKMNLYRWDFRFNNLCNLACIGCGPSLSSSWVDLHKKMWPLEPVSGIYNSNKNKDEFIKIIKSQAKIVEEVYFAGGEPLLHSEHYEIMHELENLGRLDKVFFTYSTNLTNLQFKNHNAIDYWVKTKKCKILVSLDEVDPKRLHYIRYPSNLDQIIENWKIINQTMTQPEHILSIVPTWNILNIHRIKNVIEYFYHNDLLPKSFHRTPAWESDFHNIILMFPQHLCMSVATDDWKRYINNCLNEYEQWYNDNLIPLKEPAVREWSRMVLKMSVQKIRNVLKEEVKIDYDYVSWYKRLDEARSTNFTETFPELKWFLP